MQKKVKKGLASTKNKQQFPQLTVKFKPSLSKINVAVSSKAYRFLYKIWDKKTIGLQESVYVLFLDQTLNVITWRLISIGTKNQCLVDIKLITKLALETNSDSIIISHNHPSGDTKPSILDNTFTLKLRDALYLFDIAIRDHIIISPFLNKYFSFADHSKLVL